jgi:hypothetical protein
MFSQPGLPRQIAERGGLYYADRINDQSPMWMGFADQQTSSTGPAAACTFAGNASSQLTTARQGDYFDNGGIQNLSHVILDLEAYYARAGEAGSAEDETFLERVQYMFRSDPPPSFGGGGDPFLNGGGPAHLPSTFAGTGDAALGAQGVNTPGNQHRIGHLAALQLQTQFAVNPLDNGLERFLTSTRRQNFLCPPRRHRAFPLVELT